VAVPRIDGWVVIDLDVDDARNSAPGLQRRECEIVWQRSGKTTDA
jgi:hypothetical protein